MKKNIGIFLAYAPDQSIKSHGISRLLSFMLHGMLQSDDTDVVIATPAWFEKNITEFMEDQQIDTKKIKLLTTDGIPYLLRIKNFLLKRKKLLQVDTASPKKTFFQRVSDQQKKQAFHLFMNWVCISSTPKFVLTTFLVGLIGLSLSPLILLGVISYLVLRIARKMYRASKKNDSIHLLLPKEIA